MKQLLIVIALLFVSTLPAFGNVTLTSPANGTTVSSLTQYTASATTTCARGVSAIGVYVDGNLAKQIPGSVLNAQITLAPGTHNTVVQEWDMCGGSSGVPVMVTASNQNGVYVTAPGDGDAVGSSVQFNATATTSCAQGVAAMGVYSNNQLVAVQQGSTMNQLVALPLGAQNVVVQSWDMCGQSTKRSMILHVQNGQGVIPNGVHTLSDLQAVVGWNQWGELAPVYDICSPCNGIGWNMTQNVSSVSLSGNATRFDIGGSAPYGDVLWSVKLMGQGTTENLPDLNQTLVPSIYHFIYDADVFVTNTAVTQDLEFDVNMFGYSYGLEFGTECNNLSGKEWDIWDNVNAKWVATGIPCKLLNNAWNHVSIEVERQSDNSLLYKTITLNGVEAIVNKVYPHFTVPQSWYGVTANFQMDGDYKMSTNTTYLDNFSIRYW